MGTEFLGTICPWGPNWLGIELAGDQIGWGPNWLGTNFLGTVCPGGPNCMGTICPEGPINWGPFVQGDRKGGTGSPGTKCVRDQMSLSRSTGWGECAPPPLGWDRVNWPSKNWKGLSHACNSQLLWNVIHVFLSQSAEFLSRVRIGCARESYFARLSDKLFGESILNAFQK